MNEKGAVDRVTGRSDGIRERGPDRGWFSTLCRFATWAAGLPFLALRGSLIPGEGGDRDDGDDVLFISQYHWEMIWRRNQHVATHLSRSRKILYLTPFPCRDFIRFREPGCLSGRWVSKRIFALSVPLLPGETALPLVRRLNRRYLLSVVRRWSRKAGISPGILWFSHPYAESISKVWRARSVVYDVQDEFPATGRPRDIFDREVRLLERSDLVLTGTYSLRERKGRYARNIHFVPCGVDYDHFHRACEESVEVPRDLAAIKAEKTLGYYGAIGDRIDWPLLRDICVGHPGWAVVLIGTVSRIGPEVEGLGNIHFLGARSYDELPRYLRGFDVCLIPFRIDEYTRYIYPTKLLEYLSAGRPVISSPIPDVERFFSDIVGIAGGIDRFEEELARVEGDPERVRKGIEMAREMSWERAVGEMERLLEETLDA